MIIGFTGRKGSGKDTAARVLEDDGFVHLKMADALKMMLRSLLLMQGLSQAVVDRMIEGDLKETPTPFLAGRTPRYAMQTLGTEWGRNLMDENFWVGVFSRTAARFSRVVCSDVRFPNEVAACDQVIRIERLGVERSDTHISEAMIDELQVHQTLVNDAATVAEFQGRIRLLDIQ